MMDGNIISIFPSILLSRRQIGDEATGGDEGARLRERKPDAEVRVTDEARKLFGELIDQAVQAETVVYVVGIGDRDVLASAGAQSSHGIARLESQVPGRIDVHHAGGRGHAAVN